MKALKANNPLYIGQMASRVQEYYRRLNALGMTYETLYTYFTGIIQHGREAAEFWIVFDDDNKPLGFAVFTVMPVPYVGKVNIDHIYAWGKEKGVSDLMIDKAIEFAGRHNAPLISGTAIKPSIFRLWKRRAEAKGFNITQHDNVSFTVRI